jgi:hypothetical protein
MQEAKRSYGVFANGCKPRQAGFFRPQGGERKVHSLLIEHSTLYIHVHIHTLTSLLHENCKLIIPKVVRILPSLSFFLRPFEHLPVLIHMLLSRVYLPLISPAMTGVCGYALYMW